MGSLLRGSVKRISILTVRGWLACVLSILVVAAGLVVTPIQPTASVALAPLDPAPPTYDQVVLADAPSLYYRFDETSGAYADSSGRNISGLNLAAAAPLTANGPSGLANATSAPSVGFSGRNTSTATSVAAGLPTGNTARSVEYWWRNNAGGTAPVGFGWGNFEVMMTSEWVQVAGYAVYLPSPPYDHELSPLRCDV